MLARCDDQPLPAPSGTSKTVSLYPTAPSPQECHLSIDVRRASICHRLKATAPSCSRFSVRSVRSLCIVVSTKPNAWLPLCGFSISLLPTDRLSRVQPHSGTLRCNQGFCGAIPLAFCTGWCQEQYSFDGSRNLYIAGGSGQFIRPLSLLRIWPWLPPAVRRVSNPLNLTQHDVIERLFNLANCFLQNTLRTLQCTRWARWPFCRYYRHPTLEIKRNHHRFLPTIWPASAGSHRAQLRAPPSISGF